MLLIGLFKAIREDELLSKGLEVIKVLLPDSFPTNGTSDDFESSYQVVKRALAEYGPWKKSRYINCCLKFLQETDLFSAGDQRFNFCGDAGNVPVNKARSNLLSLIREW